MRMAPLAALALLACRPAVIRAPLPPPPARFETVPQPPGPDYAWIPGRWIWDERKEAWSWRKGYHARRPPKTRAYRAGRWVQRGYYWSWIPGRWVP